MLNSEQIDFVLKKVRVKRQKGELRLMALRRAILAGKPVADDLFRLPGFGRGTWNSLLDLLDIEQCRGIKARKL